MKKTLFIIIAIIVLLVIAAVWLYLFLYGAPKSADEVFANLNIGAAEEGDLPPLPPPIAIEENPTVDVGEASALKQLSIKPVVGHGYVVVLDEEGEVIRSAVRYVEEGTGHVFEINLDTGEEVRLTNTTIPRVQEATFSPDGNSVVLKIVDDYTISYTLGTIAFGSDQALNRANLPGNIRNVQYVDNDTLAYSDNTGIYSYSIPTAASTLIANTALSDINIHTPGGEFLFSNRFSPDFTGSIFAAGSLRPLLPLAKGFHAEAGTEVIVYGANTGNNNLFYTAYNRASQTNTALPINIIPEKCDFADEKRMVCAAEVTTFSASTLKEWYQGQVIFNDRLWVIDLETGAATYLLNPEDATGRRLDITDLSVTENTEYAFFINKTDNTLWQYEL